MALVKQLDKRSGITYVYESVSYWNLGYSRPESMLSYHIQANPLHRLLLDSGGSQPLVPL